jgi:hypothetical protein
MKLVCSSLLTLLLCMPAHPFDAALTSGLDVTVESVPETVIVDGAEFTIQRATGADVTRLAERVESRWRLSGSVIRSLQQGPWTMRSRMQGAFSEVLQWRSDEQGDELLWSSLRSDAPPAAAPSAGIVLPPQCAWGRAVSGHSGGRPYLQRSARCAMGADSLRSALETALPAQGWHLSTAGQGMLLDRPGADGLVSITPLGVAAAWLIWLRVDQRAGPP